MERKIRVDLCPDHFLRLCKGDVCSTCPSHAENEAVVKAMSLALEQTAESQQAAVISELHSIRSAQSGMVTQMKQIKHKLEDTVDETAGIKIAISGDAAMGHKGLVHRVEANEGQVKALETFRVKLVAGAIALSSLGGGIGSWLAGLAGK